MVSLQKIGAEAKNSSGYCSKFWRGWTEGNKFYANWGKIGTTGQSKQWDFTSSYEAEKHLAEKVREKLNKDYVRLGSRERFVVTAQQIVNYVMDETEIDNLDAE